MYYIFNIDIFKMIPLFMFFYTLRINKPNVSPTIDHPTWFVINMSVLRLNMTSCRFLKLISIRLCKFEPRHEKSYSAPLFSLHIWMIQSLYFLNPNFELILDIMHVKNRINSNRKIGETSTFRRSRAANSVVYSRILPNFELIQAFMHVLIPASIKTIEF